MQRQVQHAIASLLAALAGGMIAAPANADALIAVASNFRQTAHVLAEQYERDSGQRVRLSAGSSGKLYAQLLNGAPFDAFLSADARRPRLLQESGHAVAGTRFTYASGRLVVWSADPAHAGADCMAVLREGRYRRLAIASPRVAPYGLAAKQTLVEMGLWGAVRERMVTGENVTQALQFAASGSADLALVADAQTRSGQLPAATCKAEVPASLHAPIEQQAVLIRPGNGAEGFLAFLQTQTAQELIEAHGYARGKVAAPAKAIATSPVNEQAKGTENDPDRVPADSQALGPAKRHAQGD